MLTITRIYTLLIFAALTLSSLFSATNGDAIIYPNKYIGEKIEYFFFDMKGWPGRVNTAAKAKDFFVDDDMNGVRVSIYGDDTRPAHPAPGIVDDTYYTPMLNSMNRAKTARGNKDFYVFASKKLDGQTSFPHWTKDENGVIVTEYVKLLQDYLLFMKDKGFEVDFLAIQNEEEFNEGQITPAKHKAIVDSLRNITARLNLKMPLIVGYEDYGPDKEDWVKIMHDNNWLDRMDIYGTHYYPRLRPIKKLNNDLRLIGDMPFWSTEPHWDQSDDDFNDAEAAMCALWDQIEVRMSGFMWWNYNNGENLRSYLMRVASVPLKDAQMVDMDDIDGRETTQYGRLQTRTFRKDNTLTIYIINNNVNLAYPNYGFELSGETIQSGSISYQQWIKGEGHQGIIGNDATMISSRKFRLNIPKESITVITLQLTPTGTQGGMNSNQKENYVYQPLNSNVLYLHGNSEGDPIQIISNIGQVVVRSNQNEIDISHLVAGMYIVRNSKGETSKFLKY
ncbi:MAG: T9SS type A sorting domain-containing protein [Pigmentiphaga sp.]|nr:T9SS type A sorting domain-containing protein [Pigmentiphaga sp.]